MGKRFDFYICANLSKSASEREILKFPYMYIYYTIL